MKKLLCAFCLLFFLTGASFGCKQGVVDNSSVQSNRDTDLQASSKAPNLIMQKAGLKNEQIAQLKSVVKENMDLFDATVQQARQKLTDWSQASPERRVQITTDVFRLFISAFLPITAQLVFPGDPKAVVAKATPLMEQFLKDVGKATLERLQKAPLRASDRAAMPMDAAEELAASLGIPDAGEVLTALYSSQSSSSGMALTGSGNTFAEDFQTAVPNTSVIFGLFSGILVTLIAFLVTSAAVPAMTIGAVVGVGWVCIVACFRAAQMALGML